MADRLGADQSSGPSDNRYGYSERSSPILVLCAAARAALSNFARRYATVQPWTQIAALRSLIVERPVSERIDAHRDFPAAYDDNVWHVYGFLAYRLRNRADAEDLTQRTFERALRSWSRYDCTRGSLTTWLLAIARNLLIDHLRADRTSRQQSLDDVDAVYDALVAALDRVDIGLAPDLERAMTVLTTREREIIALRFGGELNGREIADMTGLTLANVQQILSRSLRRMRAELEQTELRPRLRVADRR
ncbi:MAG: RNA polymerase sigma factor [Solirubrobacteraceae bacterium]